MYEVKRSFSLIYKSKSRSVNINPTGEMGKEYETIYKKEIRISKTMKKSPMYW